jgi:hypothetical protein
MADVALSSYGIRLIPNDRVFHIFEDWPGLDRRKVSGSIWNPIGLAFLIALTRAPIFFLVVRLPKASQWKAKKTRCAHRTWKSAKQLAASRELPPHLGIGRAWEDDTAARHVLQALKSSAPDRGAPVPLCRQQHALTGRSSERRSYVIERGVAYPGAAIGHGGATDQEKRRATIFAGQVNACIGDLRDQESKLPSIWRCTWQLDNPEYWSGRSRPSGKILPWGASPLSHNVTKPGRSKIPRCTGSFFTTSGLPVFTGRMRDHPSWPWVQSVRLGADPAWSYVILHEKYDVGTAPLKEPRVGPCKVLPRADVQAFALAEWWETNHRRAQIRKRPSKPTSGTCRKPDGPVTVFSLVSLLGRWSACGWRGGRCCRLVSCPLNACRVPWVARRGGDDGRCDDD